MRAFLRHRRASLILLTVVFLESVFKTNSLLLSSSLTKLLLKVREKYSAMWPDAGCWKPRRWASLYSIPSVTASSLRSLFKAGTPCAPIGAPQRTKTDDRSGLYFISYWLPCDMWSCCRCLRSSTSVIQEPLPTENIESVFCCFRSDLNCYEVCVHLLPFWFYVT